MKREKIMRQAIKKEMGIKEETTEITIMLDSLVKATIATQKAYKEKNRAQIAVEIAKDKAKAIQLRAKKIEKEIRKATTEAGHYV